MIVSRCVIIDGACLTEEADTSENGGRIASKKEWQRGAQSVQMCGRVVWRRCIQERPNRAIVRSRLRRKLMVLRGKKEMTAESGFFWSKRKEKEDERRRHCGSYLAELPRTMGKRLLDNADMCGIMKSDI
ncbi:hypothetical protein TNCV_4882111 [Trichonephila clavipes]|nr:hypothetical protein TNCV_4882111 [Trichonephila clavipes]